MTGDAVARARVLEQREPAPLRRAELRTAIEVVVVLAAVGMKGWILEFEVRDGLTCARERLQWVPENRLAKHPPELAGIGRKAEPVRDLRRSPIGHFIRGQQRESRLRLQRVETSIP